MALKGSLTDLSVVDLVKIHCVGQARACVHLTGSDGNADIFFDNGNITDAIFGSLSGLDAVYRALALTDGQYQIELNVTSVKHTVSTGWPEIIQKWESTDRAYY
jgi:hypothetical protein